MSRAVIVAVAAFALSAPCGSLSDVTIRGLIEQPSYAG